MTGLTGVHRVGAAALLVECPDHLVPALFAAAVRRRDAGSLVCTDVVPGARTVLLDGLDDVAAVAADLGSWALDGQEDVAADAAEVVLEVTYDGPDLDEVARLSGLTVDEVVRRHREAAYVVAFCGFAPGFAYLSGLPEELHVPRRADPRARVPAGSVGLAGAYAGVYPSASPGGWQLVARTTRRLWDSGARPPALLAPGTRVRFDGA